MSDFTNDLKPGDIINVEGAIPVTFKDFFWDLAVNEAITIIEDTQATVFGQKYKPEAILCKDNHTTMYLGDGKIFSCQPPTPLIFPVSEYDTEPKRIMTICRMNPDFFKRTLTDEDINILKQGCQLILDMRDDKNLPISYDIGQNADILVNTLAGYPWQDQIHIFDADGNNTDEDIDISKPKVRQHMVCSVAVASILAFWRHKRKELYGDEITQPWTVLNPNAWTPKTIENFNGSTPHWAIGATFPAQYALAKTHFQNEFTIVGRYLNGKRKA